MKNLLRNFLLLTLAFFVIAALFSAFSENGTEKEIVGLETVINKINDEEVREVKVSGNNIEIILNDEKVLKAQKEGNDSFASLISDFAIAPEKLENIKISVVEESGFNYWFKAMLPIILPIVIIGFFIIFMNNVII